MFIVHSENKKALKPGGKGEIHTILQKRRKQGEIRFFKKREK
ncbi:hypothetical protein SC09_Contig25orf00313 [Bacillus subtilis]|uniref:Uncharacterized protein n=1 Tax=Bacillus subtilis TaxID=1423 RepID=A0A0D1KWE3_BACIU|nr:hypothetical protein SC09_Contig25orf00313 [Bacillus subtilis]